MARRNRRDEDEDDDDMDIRRRDGELATRMLIPVGRSGWAILAGYLALFSVLCLPAPFALIAGLLAIRDMRRDPNKHGLVRAWFGIIMGGVGSAVLLFTLVAFVMEMLMKR